MKERKIRRAPSALRDYRVVVQCACSVTTRQSWQTWVGAGSWRARSRQRGAAGHSARPSGRLGGLCCYLWPLWRGPRAAGVWTCQGLRVSGRSEDIPFIPLRQWHEKDMAWRETWGDGPGSRQRRVFYHRTKQTFGSWGAHGPAGIRLCWDVLQADTPTAACVWVLQVSFLFVASLKQLTFAELWNSFCSVSF